ncbi:Non-canonical poly(A) RNA polymerase papd5 [Dermatophagoides pteronyssinus]|uniref:Non-canonical poly(A) RNA polymerase papd5 n=1 Tax=Dermatophagoides pteronyssinus TaxID=6956 RepID=A0ABQ8J8M4_DERPT|nr:Non-canonical poly(A) RNA polymerase papd5 [Dermatophagoides pteronyssinus]
MMIEETTPRYSNASGSATTKTATANRNGGNNGQNYHHHHQQRQSMMQSLNNLNNQHYGSSSSSSSLIQQSEIYEYSNYYNYHNHNHYQSHSQQQQQQRRKHPNYFSFIKRSSLNKGSFEINGRHNECISRKDNVYYVENLKFPDCVVRNLCQIYKYQGELWFKNHLQDNNHHNNDNVNGDNGDDHDDDNDTGNNDDVDENKEKCLNQQQKTNDSYETIYEKIHVELNDFYSFIKPLKEDEILRKATFFCLADSIKKLPFVKQVKYYGSYSSKTYLPVSDIDLVVYCNLVNDELQTLFLIGERLSYDGIIENRFIIIPLSRIPLLKFNDSLTGLPINITLNTINVMERSQYIRDQIRPNSHQMKILFFLKYYLLSKGTNQVFYGGIGSYALALMVIRFFQEESVKELVRNEMIYPNSILGYLLMGFFERFGDVNFFKNHIISVHNDGDYIECDYLNNDNNNHHHHHNHGGHHIEPWNDVSHGSFNSAEILKDFQYLHDKFMKADKCRSKSLLGQVLYVVDSFVEYRNLLLYLFRKWFDDYDVKDYLSGKYPSKAKFQEFIEKRRIFQKQNLSFTQKYLEDKSLEFSLKLLPPTPTSPLSSSNMNRSTTTNRSGRLFKNNDSHGDDDDDNDKDDDTENIENRPPMNITTNQHYHQRPSNINYNHYNNHHSHNHHHHHRNNYHHNQNRHFHQQNPVNNNGLTTINENMSIHHPFYRWLNGGLFGKMTTNTSTTNQSNGQSFLSNNYFGQRRNNNKRYKTGFNVINNDHNQHQDPLDVILDKKTNLGSLTLVDTVAAIILKNSSDENKSTSTSTTPTTLSDNDIENEQSSTIATTSTKSSTLTSDTNFDDDNADDDDDSGGH